MITNSIQYRWLLAVSILSVALVGGDALGARGGGGGGGGGSRGGGGGFSGGGGGSRGGGSSFSGGGGSARPSFSNSGSIRYSAPRQTPSQPVSRPAAPATRPAAPVTRPAAPVTRPAAPVARPATPIAAQRPAIAQPGTPSYKPPNYGSIVNSGGGGNIQHGSVTTPGGATIGGIKGPGGGGAVGIVGPGGGAGGVAVGPGGGGAAAIRGPGGGAAGAIWTPSGYGAAGFRGSNGYGVAGIRGPYGSAVVTNLPSGAIRYPYGGHDYWHVGFGWYGQYWRGDDVYYGWVYPPIGFYYSSLPEGYTTVVVKNTTYYCSDDVYLREGEKDGQKGYVVAEAPEVAKAEQGENPFNILKGLCDYVAGLEKFTAIVSTTTDEVLESGEKVQLSSRRTLYVSRPDHVAVDALVDGGEKRSVYDGKTVSMFDRAKNVYATVQMPPTIDAALDILAQNYGIAMPLADLLYKDAYARLVNRVATGQYVGLHKVGDIDCHHLAFSGDTVDWEVWIEAGVKPVLRKVTIDYKQDAVKPRYSALVVGWVESPVSLGDAFEFKPPAGAKQIEMLPVRAVGGATAPKPGE